MDKVDNSKCPMCSKDLMVSGETTDMHCDGCGRDWYYIDAGSGERYLASRRRKVDVVKPITEGDKLDDCIKPVATSKEMREFEELIKETFKATPNYIPEMIDNIGRLPTDGEVIVIQFLRPSGEPRLMYAPCGDKELVQCSRKMAISAELLRTGEICIYSRRDNELEEDEHIEICPNGPEVSETLKKAIKAKIFTGGIVNVKTE